MATFNFRLWGNPWDHDIDEYWLANGSGSNTSLCPWLDTYLDVEWGDALTITATGSVSWVPGGWRTVNGAIISGGGGANGLIMPSEPFMKLIGRIGQSTSPEWFFAIGGSFTGVAPASGRLYLSFNEYAQYSDNDGYFDIVVMADIATKPDHECCTTGTCEIIYSDACPPYVDGVGLREPDKIIEETLLDLTDNLKFNFTFANKNQTNSDFEFTGLGATHNHASKLALSGTFPNRTATVRWENGSIIKFEEEGANNFPAKPGSSAKITSQGGDFVLELENKSSYTFDGGTLQLTHRDWANGEALTYDYDGSGRLITVDDGYDLGGGGGRQLQFSYINNPSAYNHGQLWRVGDHTASGLDGGSPSGRYVEFTYTPEKSDGTTVGSPKALIASIRDVQGNIKTFDYYGQHAGEADPLLLNKVTKREGPAVDTTGNGTPDTNPVLEELSYTTSDGEITHITQTLGGSKQTVFAYRPSGDAVTTQTTGGQVTTHYFSEYKGELANYLGSDNPAGEGGQRALNGDFRSKQQTDARGHITQLAWSNGGSRLDSVTDAKGNITSFDYNSNDTLASSTDAEGRQTLYFYAPNQLRQAKYRMVMEGENLAVNGDMEANSDWTNISGAAPQTNERSATQINTGQYARHVVANATNQGIEGDVFDLIENQPYVVVAHIYPVSGTVKMGVTGTSSFDATTGGTGSWETLLIRHTPSSGATGRKLQFTANGGAAEFYVDTVLIIEGDLLDWQTSTYNNKGRSLVEQTLDPQDGVTVLRETTRTYYTSGSSNGLLESVTQSDLGGMDDITTTYLYDELGRVIQVNQSSNFGGCSKSRTIYDAVGNVVASICNYDPEAAGVTSFDSSTHPEDAAEATLLQQETTDPEVNQVTIHVYDALNRRIETTTNPGEDFAQTTVTVYDASNRVVRTIANFDGNDTNGDPITNPYTADRSLFRHSAGSEINTRNLITETVYNERGMVQKQIDVLGNVILFGYNDAGRLVKTIQSASQPNYNNGYTGTSPDPDLSSYVVSGEPDEDVVTSSVYDPNGNLVKSIDPLGHITLMGYDALNRVIKTVRNAYSPNYDWENDPQLMDYPVSPITDVDQITTQTYDPLGRVRISTDVSGEVMLYGYDSLGRTVRTIRNASQPDYDWEADPDLSEYMPSLATDQDIISLTTYDSDGRTLHTEDVNGERTWLAYDGLGRQVKTIAYAVGTATDSGSNDPRSGSYTPSTEADEDLITQTNYDAEGRVKWTQDVLGHYALFGYDERNRRVRVVRNAINPSYDTVSDPDLSSYTPSGEPDEDQITQTIYDNRGRVWKTLDTRGNEARFEYDELGRRIKTIQNYEDGIYNASYPDEDIISTTEYDLAGRVIKTIDPAGRETRFEYDLLGRRTKTIANYEDGVFNPSYPDEDLISTTTYNVGGQVVSTADARQTLTTFTYDGSGRRLTATTAANTDLSTTISTIYDKSGRVIEQIDSLGNATKFVYDRLGRRIRQVNATGNESLTVYHKDGRVHWVADPEGTITYFIYDQARRLIRSIQGYQPIQSEAQRIIIFDQVYTIHAEQIFSIRPDGTNLTLISDENFARQKDAALSPDGTRLVVIGDPDNEEAIYTMDIGGGNRQWIRSNDPPIGYRGSAIWSPQGDWIYYSAWVESDTGIFRIHPDGGDEQLFYYKEGYTLLGPVWSPDESRLAMTGYLTINPNDTDIYTIDSAGNNFFNVTANGTAVNYAPTWSPDGLHIAFHARGEDGWRQIWSIAATGGEVKRLTDGNWHDRTPVFSADGTQIAFISERHGNRELYVMNADGSNQTRLTTNSVKDDAPFWATGVIDPATWEWSVINNRWEDGLGNPVSHGINNDRNVITDYTYDKAGRRLTMIDSRRYTTTYTYDDLNRRLTLTNPLSQTWSTVYTDLVDGGYKVTLTDPMTYVTERVFDRLGRLIEINFDHVSTPNITFAYDTAGNRIQMTEENGALVRETLYNYDDANRLIQVQIDTDGDTVVEETVNYQYDAGGLRTQMTVDGLDVVYEYNQRGQLTKLVDWDNQVTVYTYDNAGRIKLIFRPNGITTIYDYDAMGRLKDLFHTKDSQMLGRHLYTLDKRGNRIQATEFALTDSGGTDVVTSTDPRIEYFAGSWSTEGDCQVSANLNARLRLPFIGKTLSITLGNGTDYGLAEIWIDDVFWGTRDLYSDSTSEETIEIECYTDTIHLLEIRNRGSKNNASSGHKISFKSVEVETNLNSQTMVYNYDALSRVAGATYFDTQDTTGTPAREYTYTYDRASNRTNETLGINGTQQYSHDFTYNGANQLTNAGYTYDDNGNLTHNGTHAYTWDRANRLLSHNGSSYAYNGLGQRVSQTVSSVVTQYLQDTQPALFRVIKSDDGTNTERFIHDITGIHSHESDAGDWVWMLKDGLGSVRDIRDEAGNSPYRELYSPYGEPFGGTGTNPTDYSYTGEWQDQNDLVYLRARYYDPATGNFISQDPLETPNRYGYVMGNPIRFIDPTGLNFEDIIPCGLRLPLPYQINQHDIVLCPDSPPPNQAHLTYLAQNEVFLTVNSPECPNDQLAECKPGCWTADGVEYIYKSVQAQNQKINAGSGTFTEYFPKVLVVMSGHDDLYAAYTPPTGTTRTIIWNNGREQWSNGTVIFSPELVTHEFGHVLIQENRGIGIHNQFITAAGGNPAVANISTADGVQTLSIWAPFDSGLPPFDINNPDYNPRTSGRIYGPRGERDFVAISLYAEANGLDYGTAESNWRTFDQQTQKIWIDQATPLMTDERTAEGYAVWVHDVYSTDSRISGQVEAQRVFWNNLFQLATQE